MKVMQKIIVNATMVSGLALMGLAGCQTDGSSYKDFFPKDDETRRTREIVNAQVATGAREDATIQPFHFDGSKLNSLGTRKLTEMVPTDTSEDVTVYLNLPAGDATAPRHDAVVAFLKTCGVDESHIKVENGPNVNLSHFSNDEIINLSKTEVSGDPGAAASGGGASSSGGSASASGGSMK
jgi:hypothetical protein